MRGACTAAAGLALAAVLAGPVNGDTVSTFVNGLPMPHHEHFNDFSWEQIVDVGGDGIVGPGDILEGVFDIESIGMEGGSVGVNRLSTGGSGDAVEATGYFRALVTGKTLLGPNPAAGPWRFDFGPDPLFEDIYGQGAMVAAYEDPNNDFDATQPNIAQLIGTATNGLHLVTLGFTGQRGEGWYALVLTDSIPGAAGFGSSAVGYYQANLNRISSPGLQVQVAQAEPSSFAPGTFTEFSINGNLYGTASGASLPLSDSAEVFFTVVPEPATWALLVLGAACLLFWRRVR